MGLLYRAEALEAARYHGCLGAPQSQRTRWIALVLINLASLACLIWALRDVTYGDLKEDLATIDYWWVALAGAIELSVYLCVPPRGVIKLPENRTGHLCRSVRERGFAFPRG